MQYPLLVALVVSLLTTLLHAQEPSNYIAPRTEYETPDLQGIYTKNFNMALTPLERPEFRCLPRRRDREPSRSGLPHS